MQKDTIVKILSILQCQKTRNDTHKTRKPLFLQLETTTNFEKIEIFLRKQSHNAEKSLGLLHNG